jgi:rRNA-processing protein FCF1
MHPHAQAFFTDSLKEALLRNNARLIVPLEVVKELEKHAASGDPGKQKAAAAGLAIIKDYTASGVIDVRSDEQDSRFADNTFLYVFTRYRTKYHLALITQDGALARDIQNLGSQEAVKSCKRICVFSLSRDDPPQLRRRSRQHPGPHDQPGFKFRPCTDPASETEDPINIAAVPGAGAMVYSGKYGQVKLIQRIAGGGEGDIFTTSAPGLVCKIYSCNNLTVSKREKIRLMLQTAVDCPGVCWPQDMVTDTGQTFCGYLMQQAEGEPMQTSMFVKPVLLKKHPDWTRRNLVVLALTILDKIGYLHQMNVIIGDINPSTS